MTTIRRLLQPEEAFMCIFVCAATVRVTVIEVELRVHVTLDTLGCHLKPHESLFPFFIVTRRPRPSTIDPAKTRLSAFVSRGGLAVPLDRIFIITQFFCLQTKM